MRPVNETLELERQAHGPDCACVRCTGFQPGHTLSLKHGARSVLQNRRRAEEIRERLVEDAPLVAPADGAIFDVAANLLAHSERALAVLESAQREELAAIRAGTPLKPDQRQNLARLSQDTRGWLNSAMRALDRLGMSPLSRAQLGLDVARARESIVVTLQREAREREMEVRSG